MCMYADKAHFTFSSNDVTTTEEALKGLGHAILGNFSTDRMVIELTKKLNITVQNYRRTLSKHREAKKGHGWTKLERIKMD